MSSLGREKQKEMYEDICKSFRLMWDGFPHPVLLIQKSRNILDANQCARDLGVPANVRCRDISPCPEKCKKYCLADLALESDMTKKFSHDRTTK